MRGDDRALGEVESQKGEENRQPKRYGTAIPLPCLGVSVTVSKVSRAAAPKGTQSCTTHAIAGGGRGPRGEGARGSGPGGGEGGCKGLCQ